MNFIKKYRKLLVLVIISAIIISYSIIIVTRPYGNVDQSVFPQEFVTHAPIYLNVNETYDLRSLVSEVEKSLSFDTRMRIEGSFILTVSQDSLERKGIKVKAASCGFGYACYEYSYLSHYEINKGYPNSESAESALLKVEFIILSEEEERAEVHSIDDLTGENKTFVLKNDIVISESLDRGWLLTTFNGVFINPDGYSITIEESSGLTALSRFNRGVFDGIIVNTPDCGADEPPYFGLTMFNSGLLNNCRLN